MKILITGATGFVGKTLVPYLIKNGLTDLCLLIRNKQKVCSLFENHHLTYIDNSENGWQNLVAEYNPEVVLHLATLFDTHCDAITAKKIVDTNVLFTTLLLEAVSHTDCRFFVNIGTFTEFLYGNENYYANNLYSASKSAVRPIIQFYQTESSWNWINVIVYSPYGRKNEHKKVLDYMVDALESPVPIKFSGGEQILDFIHVDDMADFFYTLLMRQNDIKDSYTQFHLGTGKGYSLREIGQFLERLSGKKMNADWGAFPYRTNDTMYAVAPIASNLAILNWRNKIDILDGLLIYLKDIYG